MLRCNTRLVRSSDQGLTINILIYLTVTSIILASMPIPAPTRTDLGT